MSPGWARRIIFSAMAMVASGAAEAQEPAKADPVSTLGAPPGEAFFIDLRQGMDAQTEYVSDFDFSADWITMSLRAKNVVFGAGGMQLLAERTDNEKARYTTGEFQRRGFYGYGRYEVVMQPAAEEGIVSSFFTHTGGQFGDPHSEIDFEFVGKSPGEVHLNYYVDGQDNAANAVLGFDASKAEHLYAFEWSPGFIAWYVDGRKVREVTRETSPIGIPANSSRVMANTWTGNGKSEAWVGAPAFEKASTLYRCISHVPAGQVGRQCSDEFVAPPAG